MVDVEGCVYGIVVLGLVVVLVQVVEVVVVFGVEGVGFEGVVDYDVDGVGFVCDGFGYGLDGRL